MTYRIREVDATDEEIAEVLIELHRMTFFDAAPLPEFDNGYWWLGYKDRKPVSFAGIVQSDRMPAAGYFIRVGVTDGHRGHGLQQRHMRVLEAGAKRAGWTHMLSDTTDNLPSANNFIRAGYQMFAPESPWSFPHSIYWMKTL